MEPLASLPPHPALIMSDNLADFASLEAEHEVLLGFLYLCPVGVIQSNLDGAVGMINPQAAQLLMPLARSADIANLFTVLEGFCPELRNLATDFVAASGHICRGHRIFIGGSGPGPRVLSCSLLKVNATSMVALLQDVTQEVEQERQIRQNDAMVTALTAGVKDFALFSLDISGLIDTWNLSGFRLTGLRADEVLGRDLDSLCHADDLHLGDAAEQLLTVAREGWGLREISCCRGDGSRFWCQILVAAVEGTAGDIESYSVVMRDVTERRMTGDELRRLLTTDHLTGAANRAHFFEVAEMERARWTRVGRPLSAIMFDVDRFKHVNDSFGHAAGDALLAALVRCCQTCLKEGYTLARLGGEEFVALLPGAAIAETVRVAELMRWTVAAELAQLEGLEIGATISLGCAEMNNQHSSIDALLRAADEAMYRAKRAGRNQVVRAVPAVACPAVSSVPALA
jgi:diguanylate cyclase (GGDEF)-like protein/PAS domain S-box-containing protein